MNVFITGKNGFVGKHLTSFLHNNTDWRLLEGDLDTYLGSEIDLIINLASISSVAQSITAPRNVIENNITCLLNVLEYAKKNDTKIIHLSSIEVNGITNPYAASKAAQENIIRGYRRTYNLKIVVLRSTNIIGSHQGEEKFIPKIIHSIKNGAWMQIYETGARVYNPVINIVDAITYVARHVNRINDNIAYDIQGGESLTNVEMADRISKILGKDYNAEIIKPDADRPGYAEELRASKNTLEKIGWNPPATLDMGLEWIR